MTTSRAGEAADSNPGVYHVVCHDCITEFLVDDGSEAEQRLSEHQSETGHNMDVAALGGGTMIND